VEKIYRVGGGYMKNDYVRIQWDYEGKTDFATGTGSYTVEKVIGYSGSVVLPGLLFFLLSKGMLQWNVIQIVVGFLLAFDIGGGMVSNALNSCKRFYHSPLRSKEGRIAGVLKNHLLFSSFHVHPIIVGLLYNDMDWVYGLVWYAIFMLSVVSVYITPLYLKRPVSMLIILIAFVMNIYVFIPISGFEWLMPMLFIKIVYGHLVREEPYSR
jgi:hypothetical protein